MSRARDIADGKFANDLTVDTNTLQVDATNNKIGINKPSTSTLQAVLHTHPSGTGSIPTNYLIQQNDDNLGLVIINTNDSATYSGLRIETRSNQASGWLVANEFQSAFNGDLVFRARNAGSTSAEIARMKSTGGITFNGDTAAANALDDYEEGTFTPTVSGGYGSAPSYNAQTGIYTKIGKLVLAHIRIAVASGSRGGGALTFVGLPFTNQSTIDGGGFAIYQSNFHSTGEFYPMVNANTATVFFHEANGTSISANELDADNYDIRIAVVYQTA